MQYKIVDYPISFHFQLEANVNQRLPSVHLCSLSKQHQDTDLEFLSQGCRKQLKYGYETKNIQKIK